MKVRSADLTRTLRREFHWDNREATQSHPCKSSCRNFAATSNLPLSFAALDVLTGNGLKIDGSLHQISGLLYTEAWPVTECIETKG